MSSTLIDVDLTDLGPTYSDRNDTSRQPQRSLQVVVYTDSLGVGGAEISLGHLVAAVSQDIAITVLGVSESVVDAIAPALSAPPPRLTDLRPELLTFLN